MGNSDRTRWSAESRREAQSLASSGEPSSGEWGRPRGYACVLEKNG